MSSNFGLPESVTSRGLQALRKRGTSSRSRPELALSQSEEAYAGAVQFCRDDVARWGSATFSIPEPMSELGSGDWGNDD